MNDKTESEPKEKVAKQGSAAVNNLKSFRKYRS